MTPEEEKATKNKIVSATQLEREFLREYRVSPDSDNMYMFLGNAGLGARIELSTLLSDYKEWLIFNSHLNARRYLYIYLTSYH